MGCHTRRPDTRVARRRAVHSREAGCGRWTVSLPGWKRSLTDMLVPLSWFTAAAATGVHAVRELCLGVGAVPQPHIWPWWHSSFLQEVISMWRLIVAGFLVLHGILNAAIWIPPQRGSQLSNFGPQASWLFAEVRPVVVTLVKA